MGTGGNRFYDVARQGLAFVLRLSLVLGGLGFASVLAVAQVAGGIYLIIAGHSAGGYALIAGAVVLECLVLSLIVAAVIREEKYGKILPTDIEMTARPAGS